MTVLLQGSFACPPSEEGPVLEERTEVVSPPDNAAVYVGGRRRRGRALLAGRYRLMELLGRGGSADVWRARDERTGRIVAIKMLRPDAPATLRLRFIDEARRLDDVRHPNVVPVLGSHAGDERPFIALGLIEGRRLDDLVRDGPMDLTRATRIVAQIADALDATHARGLVHADVSPANVIVTPADRAVLIDLGTAQAMDGGGPDDDVVVATVRYAAPEILRGEPPSRAADVFGLGLLAYELLAGMAAYARIDAAERAGGSLPPPLRALRSDLPAAVDDVVMRALALDPATRHNAAGDLARELAALAAPAPPSRQERAGALFRTVRRRAPMAVAALMVVAALGSIGGRGSGQGLAATPARPGIALAPRPSPARAATFSLPPTSAYDAELAVAAGEATVRSGETWQVTVAYRNTGWAGWYRGVLGAEVGLEIADPLDETVRAAIDPGNWQRRGRPAVQTTDHVGPGQLGWFVVQGRAPEQAGVYRLRLRPAIEGRGWLRDTGIVVTLNVR